MVSRPTRPRPDAHRAARQLDASIPIGGSRRSTFRRGGGYDGPQVTRQMVLSTRTIIIGSILILASIWVLVVNNGWLTLEQLAQRPVVVPSEQLSAPATPQVRYLVPGSGQAANTAIVAFATVEGIDVLLPAPSARVLWQPSEDVRAMALAPQGQRIGSGQAMQSPQQGVVPPYVIHEDPEAVRPLTGKAIVLITPGTDLVAPVTGIVREVIQEPTTRTYTVVVAMDQRKDLHVVIGGLATTPLLPGHRLEGGNTLIGRSDQRPWADVENPAGLAGLTIGVRPST